MIEVRVDVDHMQAHQHNIMHSIGMMAALREAGMPVIGKIIFNGPARGKLVSWRECDLDQDVWVVRWFDDGEGESGVWTPVTRGSGAGFTYACYSNGKGGGYKTAGNNPLLSQPNAPTEEDDL